MSEENVEIMRRLYELFNRGDHQAWLDDLLHEDVVLDERYLFDSGIYHGHKGVRRWLGTASGVLKEARYEMPRWFDGDNVVVTDVILHVKGISSEVPTKAHIAHLARMRDGKIVYFASFPTLENALEAAGLSK